MLGLTLPSGFQSNSVESSLLLKHCSTELFGGIDLYATYIFECCIFCVYFATCLPCLLIKYAVFLVAVLVNK